MFAADPGKRELYVGVGMGSDDDGLPFVK